MNEAFLTGALIALLGLLTVAVILLIVLLTRGKSGQGEAKALSEQLQKEFDRSRREAAEREDRASNRSHALQTELIKQQGENQKNLLQQQSENQRVLYETLENQNRQMRATLSESVEKLQTGNEKKLDEIRTTVDEKLNETLTNRINTSFAAVSKQLTEVYRSLGEMKELSSGVSDLQRVLTNVKARGTWAEVQLGNILEQTLTSDQYATNVSIKNNAERVEFAVRIPSRDRDGETVWLPIDSKFPVEDYLNLQTAADRADKEATDAAVKALETRIRAEAKEIQKYISVPETTNFAILFLPTEGLYAEVLRRPGLAEDLQNNYHIMVTGPTTITAFLNTVSMGFRTIALDKKAAEVWDVLGAVRGEYEKFDQALLMAKKSMDAASNHIEKLQTRNRQIGRALKTVESADNPALLGMDEPLALPDTEE